ncbi:FUSC family protein [Phycicoccus sp. MAQZ13P-2]|uniref:FUSC family protein n=1 Tax=Phycicoccus mangrovi TaxID=2840470 RepID=UPI001C00298A|nr:FUSC family protein [Phycicoccus mangrovi]MBT9275660.1 FUSC family protein [Phycicoccus mangrovi]
MRRLVGSPAAQTEALQLVKSSVASVLAWLLADAVLGLADAFLAPWVALLTVHATVRRSLWRGLETVLTVGVGLLVAFVTVRFLGASAWSLGVAIFVGLALGRVRWVPHEGVTIATTALFVIITGETSSEERAMDVLPDRLADTVIGVAVALLVNLLVVPPLDDRSARERIDLVDRRLGRLLRDIAARIDGDWTTEDADQWIEETRAVDADVDHAWSLVRFADEARLWNPRRHRHPRTHPTSYPEVLERLEEGVAQVRGIARHLRESAESADDWDTGFRTRFAALLERLGRRIAVPDRPVEDLRTDLRDLADDLATARLSGPSWPLYGALIANTLTIIDVVDDVATARGVRE